MTGLVAGALLFDMDGVLVQSGGVVERTWTRWAARHGLDAGPLLRVAHGRRTSDTLRAVCPALAVPEEVAWLDAAELDDLEGIVAVPGAPALTRLLPARAWAVVTSAGRALAERRLARAGVPLPDVLVTSDDIPRGKPAPDGYLLAAERLALDPGRCVVVEDTPPGIAAGKAAGMRVVAISTTHAADRLRGADYVTPDLTAFRVRASGTGLAIDLLVE